MDYVDFGDIWMKALRFWYRLILWSYKTFYGSWAVLIHDKYDELSCCFDWEDLTLLRTNNLMYFLTLREGAEMRLKFQKKNGSYFQWKTGLSALRLFFSPDSKSHKVMISQQIHTLSPHDERSGILGKKRPSTRLIYPKSIKQPKLFPFASRNPFALFSTLPTPFLSHRHRFPP